MTTEEQHEVPESHSRFETLMEQLDSVDGYRAMVEINAKAQADPGLSSQEKDEVKKKMKARWKEVSSDA